MPGKHSDHSSYLFVDNFFQVMNAQSLAGWYMNIMVMQVSENAANKSWTAFYPGEGVKLVFQEVSSGAKYKSNRDSWYWKIGVTVSDVDLAREKIMASGMSTFF